ncbi:hypothetical protein [Fournierella massiliensis]|uniref:hypothetical protein n=1 Tax=Allofournierella massiliensis TaxID=1650663 RepID=UPI00352098E0
MNKWIKKTCAFIATFLLCSVFVNGYAPVLALYSYEVIPARAFRETLPIRYEKWYSYKLGVEERNFTYRDFTFVNGYTKTEKMTERIQLTPLDYEFYEKAEVWEIEYHFY